MTSSVLAHPFPRVLVPYKYVAEQRSFFGSDTVPAEAHHFLGFGVGVQARERERERERVAVPALWIPSEIRSAQLQVCQPGPAQAPEVPLTPDWLHATSSQLLH